jgi:hypothetical protein
LKRGDLIVIAREPPSGLAGKPVRPSNERPPIEEARKEQTRFEGEPLRR